MKRSLRSWLWRVPTQPGSGRRTRVPHRDADARTGRARHGREDRARDRAVAHRRPRTAQTDLRGPGQKARSRDATDTVARRAQRRCDLRVPADAGDTRFHTRRRPDAGARHRRQQRDLRARRCDLPPAAALHHPARSVVHAVGAISQRLSLTGHAAGLRRLGRAEPDVRRHGGVPVRQRRSWSAPTASPSRSAPNQSRQSTSRFLA